MNKKLLAVALAIGMLSLNGCATTSHFYDKSTGISEYSSDVLFGVRIYGGKLPAHIKYQSLGVVTAEGWGGMTVERFMNARRAMVAKAKMLGANAVINVKPITSWSKIAMQGEAIKAEEFPDKFEETFDKPPVSYENSKIFDVDYVKVFAAVKEVLTNELYDLVVVDEDNGIIETKEIEVSSAKFKWTDADLGGPYSKLKIAVKVETLGSNKTKVTEIDTFSGIPWSEGNMKKNSAVFFKEIAQKLKKINNKR